MRRKSKRPIRLSLTTGMIYGEGLVACVKLIIGNARVIQRLVQDILSLALQTLGKLGWPQTRLPLVSDVNVVALACMTEASPQAWFGSDKRGQNCSEKCKSCESETRLLYIGKLHCEFTRVFLSHGGVCCHRERKEWGGGGWTISNAIVFKYFTFPEIRNHTVYYG